MRPFGTVPEGELRPLMTGEDNMWRAILCVTLGLFVCGDVALAKGNKIKPVTGKISKLDVDAGTLTVTNKKTGDQDFKVTDDTKIVIYGVDGTPTEKSGKSALKDPVVNVGAKVKVTVDANGATLKIELGNLPKKQK
jgi:hypothetical protein